MEGFHDRIQQCGSNDAAPPPNSRHNAQVQVAPHHPQPDNADITFFWLHGALLGFLLLSVRD